MRHSKPVVVAAVALVVAAAALVGALVTAGTAARSARARPAASPGLWAVYDQSLRSAKYLDLTRKVTPNMPVWKGFGPATFSATVDPTTGRAYSYGKDGFEATAYKIQTDQFGTQLDPPAHWAPEYAGI